MKNKEAHLQAAREAAAEPAPGPVLDTFAPVPIRAAGINLRPMVAADLLILERLDSPMHKMLLLLSQPPEKRIEPEFPGEAVLEAAYVLSHRPAENRALLACGREVFAERATAAADSMEPFDLFTLKKALVEVLIQAMSTWLSHHAPASKEAGSDFIASPMSPTTASAGSSTLSAPSPVTSI